MSILHVLYYLLLLALLLGGLLASIFGLPGLWLMVGGVWVYAWITGVDVYVGWATLWTVFALALAAEVVEFLAGAAGAKKVGGLRRSIVGAFVGAILGGIFLSLVPIPVISTVVGVCLGTFLGAAAMEFTGHGDVALSMRVGAGAAQGRFYGMVAKLGFGLLIGAITTVAAFPIAARSDPPPLTAPSGVARGPWVRSGPRATAPDVRGLPRAPRAACRPRASVAAPREIARRDRQDPHAG